jgi:hypothetical protein
LRYSSLEDLAVKYFTTRGYEINKNMNKNLKYYLLYKRKKNYLLAIKNWNRTVGVNIIINIDKDLQRNNISNAIVVAEKFSEHARAYANRRGIKLLTKSEIRVKLR